MPVSLTLARARKQGRYIRADIYIHHRSRPTESASGLNAQIRKSRFHVIILIHSSVHHHHYDDVIASARPLILCLDFNRTSESAYRNAPVEYLESRERDEETTVNCT